MARDTLPYFGCHYTIVICWVYIQLSKLTGLNIRFMPSIVYKLYLNSKNQDSIILKKIIQNISLFSRHKKY